MNENDDSWHDDGDAPTEEGGRGGLEQALAAAVTRVLSVLGEAQAEADKAGPGSLPRLVAAHREAFGAAMERFGDALADLLESAPGALDPSAVASGALAPLLEMSRDLPLFRRAQQALDNEEEDRELQRVLLSGRGAGFDLPSMLLEDYYHGTVFVRTFRGRVAAVGELLKDEVCRRVKEGQQVVRLLNLRCGGLLELDPLLENRSCSTHTSISFVDEDTSALRQTRQKISGKLTHRPTFIRADPFKVGADKYRPLQQFDIVLAFSLFDLLPWDAALGLTGNCAMLLKPGGLLLTSGYLPAVPRGERALALGLLGARVNYWDEQSWRELLERASFDFPDTRFERRAPAALALMSPRKQ